MFGLFIPLQQYHDYGESANSCTVIKAAYKVRKGWTEGEKVQMRTEMARKLLSIILLHLTVYTFCETKEEARTNFHRTLFDELVFQCWFTLLAFSTGHTANL